MLFITSLVTPGYTVLSRTTIVSFSGSIDSNTLLEADFTNEMFQYCAAVCIRPGLGTVSDALISRNRIFTFSKHDSFEMDHNAKVIESLNVGKKCRDPYHAYSEALDYVRTKEKINEQILRASHLRTDGVFATTNLILSRG